MGKLTRLLNRSAEACFSEIGVWSLGVVLVAEALAGADQICQGHMPREILGALAGWFVACHLSTALHALRLDGDSAP